MHDNFGHNKVLPYSARVHIINLTKMLLSLKVIDEDAYFSLNDFMPMDGFITWDEWFDWSNSGNR